MSSPLNIDRVAAERAQALIRRAPKEVENTLTKSLGVLQENGVYACFLYLLAKEKENGRLVVDEMLALLEKLGFGWNKPANTDAEAILKHITDTVTVDLERLLVAKETLEQMLIYARYGAKARN